MVDLDRLHQRLELLAGYLRELRRLRDLSVADYLANELFAGRYLVQVAAQTCIDLANHLIASEGWRAPACPTSRRSPRRSRGSRADWLQTSKSASTRAWSCLRDRGRRHVDATAYGPAATVPDRSAECEG